MFIVQIIISFFVGGLAIALQTLIAERVPLRWRGMILGAPSTLALGLFFVGLTKTSGDIPEVVRIVPAALAADYLYVLAFAAFSKFSLLWNFIGALFVWATSAFVVITFPPTTFISSTFVYGLPVIILTYLFTRRLPQVTTLIPVKLNAYHIVTRSLIGGSIVTLIIILAKTMGNLWGGLFSTFPAAFSSTFLIYYLVHGKQIIPSVAKSLFFPGSIGFILYAWIAAITFPTYGILLGTLAAYAGTFLFYWLYSIIQRQKI